MGANSYLSFSEHVVAVPRDLCFSQFISDLPESPADPAWARPPLLITKKRDCGVLCVDLATGLGASDISYPVFDLVS